MPEWKNDAELFAIARAELFTSVIGDVCDQIGLRRQYLSPHIRPIQAPDKVRLLIGRAMTVLEADVEGLPVGRSPFGKMLTAVDDLQRDEIYVCAGASPSYALVGELMSTAMLVRGAAGVVCDGYIRDMDRIMLMDFPVYALGSYGQDQKGRGMVLDFRVPITTHNGVTIQSGDVLAGDLDGVLVVPQAAVAEVFAVALQKARAENTVRAALLKGMSVTDAFTQYGIL